MADILIIDDDPVICDVLVQMMSRIRHESRYALTGGKGLDLAKNGLFDIVFLDVNLPDANGLDLIPKIKNVPSSPEIIIITGESDPDGAELAINSGAWNYLEKPFLRQEINLQVKRALEFRREKGAVSSPGALKRNGILGESELLKSCLEQVSIAAYSDINVLISGETGTGKELFAKTVHLNSDRSDANFVIVDCSAMDDSIAEAVLYGIDPKGSEPGRTGLVEHAHEGTLLLDDVSKLPTRVQKTFLRTMEQQTFTPAGADTEKPCRFRTIATTSEDLDKLSDAGKFRKDLLFHLKGIHIPLPSLHRMNGDIVTIAIWYIDQYCKKYGVESKGVSPEFLEIINKYRWPGNIRELINAIDKAVASAMNEPTLYSIHLPSHIKATVIKGLISGQRKKNTPRKTDMFRDGMPPLASYLASAEQNYLKHLWQEAGKDVAAASRIAGISKSSMYARLKKYKLR